MSPRPLSAAKRAAIWYEESRLIVQARDGNRCIVCGQLGTDFHHRRGKQRGTTYLDTEHDPDNGLWVCRICHGGVHTGTGVLPPALAGWIVPQHLEPRQVPVLINVTAGGAAWWSWYVLTSGGTRMQVGTRLALPTMRDAEVAAARLGLITPSCPG